MWDNFISRSRSPISLSGQSGVMPIANKYTRAQAACLSETVVAWVVVYDGLKKVGGLGDELFLIKGI